MAKKNNNIQEEIKQTPRKWARKDNIDEDIFALWKNKEITYEEYEQIKKELLGGK